MRIDHTALYVNDLEKARLFFEKYFGAGAGKLYRNGKTGFSSYFLTFDDGSRLEIMNRQGLADSDREKPCCTGYAHIAISVGSRENVDDMTKRLADDGYAVLSGPRTTGDGYYESCIADSEGNLIEITV